MDWLECQLLLRTRGNSGRFRLKLLWHMMGLHQYLRPWFVELAYLPLGLFGVHLGRSMKRLIE